MPRINIEDDLETHDEFWALSQIVGHNRNTALGFCVRFFRLAQKRFADGEGAISREELESSELACMIESGWAVPYKDGFQVKNPERHFAWLTQKHESGRKGGLAKAANLAKASGTKRELAGASERVAGASGAYPLTLPLTPPLPHKTKDPSFRRERTASASPEKVKLAVRPPGDGEGTGQFVAAYVRAYRERYGARPPVEDGKTQGEIKRLVKNFGLAKAINLMQVYLQINDPRFVRECHPFNLLMLNLSRLSVALARGLENPGDDIQWDNFWRKINAEGASDKRQLSTPNQTA